MAVVARVAVQTAGMHPEILAAQAGMDIAPHLHMAEAEEAEAAAGSEAAAEAAAETAETAEAAAEVKTVGSAPMS